MPRNLSTQSIKGINSLDSGEVFLYLVTIVDNSAVPGPTINVVNNTEDVVSQGTVYTAYAFNIVLSSDDGEQLPTIKLELDNVDQLLVEGIRSYTAAPSVTVRLISVDRPDDIEIEVPTMTLRGVQYNAQSISGDLVVEDVLNQKFPADRMTQQQYAGLF